MKSRPKRIFLAFFALIAVLGLGKAYDHYTGDFRLATISNENTAYRPKETPHDPEEEDKTAILAALKQKYHFLGKGNQSYAFVSEDRNYVLKFFKFGHFRPAWYWSLVPSVGPLKKWKEEAARSQEKRFLKVFAGYEVAYHYDKENAGLIYIHLNKTKDLNTTLTVTDKLGFRHAIDLDQVVFVLQKKVTPTKTLFVDLINRGDIEGLKMRIGQIFEMYLAEYKKGIYDRDHNLIYNTGFTPEHAVRLDVGKLRKNEQIKNPEVYKKDLEKIAWQRIDSWFKKYYPQHREEIANYMKEKLSQLLETDSRNQL